VIYIVDDDEAVRTALLLLMRAAEFEAQVFASAEELLERANFTHHDCIILDLRMPGMDGFELLGKLSSAEIEVPVIVVSAFDDRQSRARARSMGARAYFLKPVDDQALIDAIQWSLGEKECPEVRVTGVIDERKRETL
jgi:FixJ family two-component response regulator